MIEVDVDELYKLAKFTLKKHNINYDEDLVQELILHTLIKLDTYDESRGCKSTFIVVVMETKLWMLNRNRLAKKRNSGDFDYSLDTDIDELNIPLVDIIASDVDIGNDYDKAEILEKINHLIEEPLRLKLEGFTQKEIAKKLNVSQTRVCQKIKRNIQKIKKYCKENGLEYDV